MSGNDYWQECISDAAQECGLTLTKEQLKCLADSVEVGHDQYSMAFYSPPASDRLAVIEREADERYKRLEAEFEGYRDDAHEALRIALRQHPDTRLGIGKHGEVNRFGGRTERIQ